MWQQNEQGGCFLESPLVAGLHQGLGARGPINFDTDIFSWATSELSLGPLGVGKRVSSREEAQILVTSKVETKREKSEKKSFSIWQLGSASWHLSKHPASTMMRMKRSKYQQRNRP